MKSNATPLAASHSCFFSSSSELDGSFGRFYLFCLCFAGVCHCDTGGAPAARVSYDLTDDTRPHSVDSWIMRVVVRCSAQAYGASAFSRRTDDAPCKNLKSHCIYDPTVLYVGSQRLFQCSEYFSLSAWRIHPDSSRNSREPCNRPLWPRHVGSYATLRRA